MKHLKTILGQIRKQFARSHLISDLCHTCSYHFQLLLVGLVLAIFAHGVWCSDEISQEMDARAKLEEAAELSMCFYNGNIGFPKKSCLSTFSALSR